MDEATPIKKQILVLLNSCKLAVSDLQGARQRAKAEKEKAQGKELRRQKEVGAEKRAADMKATMAVAKRPKQGTAPVFELEDMPLPTASSWTRSFRLTRPFVVTGATAVFNDSVRKCLSDFGVAFDNSTLKVTDGRAHIQMKVDSGCLGGLGGNKSYYALRAVPQQASERAPPVYSVRRPGDRRMRQCVVTKTNQTRTHTGGLLGSGHQRDARFAP